MGIIASNSRESHGLRANWVLTCTTSAGSSARVWGFPDSVDATSSGVLLGTIGSGTAQSFGPYKTEQRFVVECVSGTCVAALSEADAGLSEGVQAFTAAESAAVKALVSGALNAPATIDASNAATYNGARLRLAAAATLTIDGGAWALLGAGFTLSVARTGTATLAFSGGVVKVNAAGTSGSSVTLVAAGEYAIQQGFNSLEFRLSGGAAI